MVKKRRAAHARIVGERIREALGRRKRLNKPHTHEWLAEQVGLSGPGAIGNYLRGERELRVEMLAKLAAVLGEDPIWLGAMDLDRPLDRRLERLIELWNAQDDKTRDIIFRIAEVAPGDLQPGKRLKSETRYSEVSNLGDNEST